MYFERHEGSEVAVENHLNRIYYIKYCSTEYYPTIFTLLTFNRIGSIICIGGSVLINQAFAQAQCVRRLKNIGLLPRVK